MQDGITLADILAILRRRWLLLIAPAVIGVPLAATVAWLLPSVFASSARIIVEAQQIPTDLVRSTVAQSAAERLQLIQQRLLTREILLEVAAQHGVFARRPDLSASERAAEMRRSTRIQGTGAAAGRSRNAMVAGMQITFEHTDPTVAARVANEFVTRILAQNVQARVERATGTLAFFDAEVARLNAAIDQQSARIVQFQSTNANFLPDNLDIRQSELVTLRDRSFTRDSQRVQIVEKIRELEDRLAQGEPEIAGTPEQQELRQLRSNLVVQRATLAESHPTIRRLTARIAALEAAAAQSPLVVERRTGPAVVQTAAARLEMLRVQLALLDEQIAADTARVAELEESIARTPAVGLALSALRRDLTALQTQHREAVAKRADAEMGERLEANQQAERFEVVEQAIPSDRPVSPNRPRIVLLGTAASVLLGLGLTVLAEIAFMSIRTARDLERQLGIVPVVVVPRIQTAAEERRRRVLRLALLVVLAVGLVAAVVVVDRVYMPLSLIIERVIEATNVDRVLSAIGMR